MDILTDLSDFFAGRRESQALFSKRIVLKVNRARVSPKSPPRPGAGGRVRSRLVYLTGALSTGAKLPGREASRAVAASSSRPTGVVCGADVTIPGDVSHSFAIAIIASANASSSSFPSDSVGSIMRAPGTMCGNDIVGGWNQ